MKEYSDWPTFPQLFIKGEFVGGADIVKQMFESGDLEKTLGTLVAPAKPVKVTVSPRAAAELGEALKDGTPGDVIHLTITAGWEHQLDLGPKEVVARHGRRAAASPSSSIARARRRPTASRSISSKTRPARASRSTTRIAPRW